MSQQPTENPTPTNRDDDADAPKAEQTLKIEVASSEEARERSRERLRAAIEADEPQPATLSFESPGEALSLLSDERYRLLRGITRYEPDSVSDLARAVERDKGSVSRDLKELESYGLVELVRDGQRKYPVVNYQQVEIDIDLTLDD